jgi:apolipoprotein N-acyltransferase
MGTAVLLFWACTPGGLLALAGRLVSGWTATGGAAGLLAGPAAGCVAWVAMAPFFAALGGVSARRGALLAGGYAVFGWLGSIWWVAIGVDAWLHMGPVAGVAAVLALCVYGAVPYAAYGALHARLGGGPWGPLRRAAWLATLVGVYPFLLPGYLAHALYRSPLFLQPLELGGMPLLLFLVFLVNACCGETLRRIRRESGAPLAVPAAWRPALAGALVLAAVAGWGAARLATFVPGLPDGTRGLRVALIQPAIPVRGREADVAPADRANSWDKARELTRRAMASGPVDLAVWPETPGWLDCTISSPDAYANFLVIADSATRLLTQCGHRVEEADRAADGARRVRNAAVLLAPGQGPAQVYDKRVLMPFAEYLPLEDRLPWLRRLLPGVKHYAPGGPAAPLDVDLDAFSSASPNAGRVRIVPALCYEAAFSSHVRAFAPRNAVIVVQSDDAWFGPGAGMDWNFALALPRAVEFRAPLVRVANTGVSAAVDPAGRITVELPRGRSAQAVAALAPGGRPTLAAQWGDWFLWVLGLGCGLDALVHWARRKA